MQQTAPPPPVSAFSLFGLWPRGPVGAAGLDPPSDLWHPVCSCVHRANCAFHAQVMKEVCINGNVDLDRVGSGSPVHKPELEKVNAPELESIEHVEVE